MNRPQPATQVSRSQILPALARTRHRHRRCLWITLAALTAALTLAACGGSSEPSSTSGVPISPGGSPISPSESPPNNNGSPPAFERSQLAAAKCIRKHGLPDFPDPTFGAGGAQVNLHMPADMGSSPAFYLAQKECAKRGLELAGYSPSYQPSASEMAQALVIARCMRAHGVSNWPDPARTMPSDPWRYHVQGAVPGPAGASPVFLLPKSLDFEAPAIKQAAITCHDI